MSIMNDVSWAMGGYGVFVYSAYAVMGVVVLALWRLSVRFERQSLERARQRLQREASR
jgi:heme exporter protein CcmD